MARHRKYRDSAARQKAYRRRVKTAEEKSNIKTLKRAGLYDGKISGKTTRYQKSLISKFGDFLSGKSSIVKARSEREARSLARPYSVKRHGEFLVVPNTGIFGRRGRITIKYNEKLKKPVIHRSVTVNGVTYSEEYTPLVSFDHIPPLKAGQTYGLHHPRTGSLQTFSKQGLERLVGYDRLSDAEINHILKDIVVIEATGVYEPVATLRSKLRASKGMARKKRGKKKRGNTR